MTRMISPILAIGFVLAACGERPAMEARHVPRAGSAPATANAPAPPPAEQAAPQPSPAPTSAPVAARDAFSDTVISARIKSALLSDPGMTGSDVSVNTDRGVVSLTGIIKSQEQAAIASAHASRQDGVMRIENHLSVTPT